MAKKSAPEVPTPEEKPATAPESLPASPPADSPPESSGPEASPVSAAQLNSGFEMPPPSERAIAAMEADAAAPGSPAPAPAPSSGGEPKPGELDSWNRPFDPAKYFPKKDTLGRWTVRRKTAGKPGGGASAPPPAPVASVVGEPGNLIGPGPAGLARAPDKYDLAADLYCRTGYAILDMAFDGGGEWFPENDGEHDAIKAATGAYLRHKQSEDLPPGLALALAVGTYAAGRFTKPRTKKRVGELIGLLRGPARAPGDAVPLASIIPANAPAVPAPEAISGTQTGAELAGAS